MNRLAIALAGLWLCAAAPASYDGVCPAPCAATDGTTQPAGTVLLRGLWDGVSQWNPTDAKSLALTKAPTSNPPSTVYAPAVQAIAAPLDPSVQSAIAAVQAQIPVPYTAVPPAATPTGASGNGNTYLPGNAAPPSLTRSALVTTAADGSFSVTWRVPLVSAMPVAPNPAPISSSPQPIICMYSSVTAAGLAGKCWTIQTMNLSLALVTAGVTLSPTAVTAGGIQLSVFAREPTQ